MTVHRFSAPALGVLLLIAQPGAARARPITLEQAYALAVRHHPAIGVLRQRVRQAEAARYKAWSALKPTAAFTGTFTHFDQEIVVDFAKSSPVPLSGVEPIVIQKQNQFAWNAVASLPLFRGPAYPRLGQARLGVEAARLRGIRSAQDFLLRVAQTYYLVISRQDAVRAIEQKLAVDRKHLAAARAQFEVGSVPRSIVLRADLVTTQDEQNLLAQRNALEAARRQLAILVGANGAVEVVTPSDPESPSGAESRMTADAQRARLDLLAADLGVDLALKGKEALFWGFLPSLDLTWMYRWSESAGFAGNRGSWNLMLTLNLPLYDGGLRYADLRDSESRIAEAREARRALGLEVESEIVRLRSEVASANAGVVSAEKAVKLARITAEDMEASFEVGAATQLDVLDASQRLLDAELGLTSSLYQRALSRIALTHAQGRFDPIRSKL